MKLLSGIKIIDFTRLLPGPLATHLLAQMGAEVIKIESPKRLDYARMGLQQIEGASHLFHQLNHNKTLKMIDYSTNEGRGELLELIKDADAVIEQFRPGAMTAWGVGYEEIKKINPPIVYVSMTGYGQEGERASEAGHDVNYLASAGIMSLLKDQTGQPTIPDTQFADISGAYMAVMALQAALLQKAKTGKGSFVDASLTDAMLPFLSVPYSLHSAGLDYRQFNIINGKTAVNYAIYQCADAQWISVGALELKFWNNLCEAISQPQWMRSNQLELMNVNFPKEEVEHFFKTKNRDEWMALLKGKEVCVTPVLEIEELEDTPYHQHKNNFQEFTTAGGTTLKTIRLPFKVKSS